ncbi:MAG TPA: hypothetical protein HA294_01310, partial [Nanoarchaeota archaeon]|nr:hypothetical protein [Nanoarchaeota archaeon]
RRASVSELGAHAVRNENIYIRSYKTLLANPEQAYVALDDAVASGLREILSKYDSRK